MDYKSFSEWINDRKSIMFQGAGDSYEALSENAKQCIDYAIERYITARFTPMDVKKSYHLDMCDCGHRREHHAKIHSVNYSDGKCLEENCKCEWFKFKNHAT